MDDQPTTTLDAALDAAASLCADTPGDSEYVRGQAELICDLFGIHMDHRQVVVRAIVNGEWRR
jgi:hypothetical protein